MAAADLGRHYGVSCCPCGTYRVKRGNVSTVWTVTDLLRSIALRGQHPAVIVSGADGLTVRTSEALGQGSLAFARGLRQKGIGRAEPIALWAPNSPDWIVVALGVMAAGGVLVPIDDLSDDVQVEAALDCSGARSMFTSSRHLVASGQLLLAKGVAATLVDTSADCDGGEAGWLAVRSDTSQDLPTPGAEDPAVLAWTSGTTGSPKGFFLSYRNIGSNVAALCQLGILGRDDRVLLPLPLHHAYPFVVGMLTPLTIGAPIILPADATGPSIMQALRSGDITTIVGVPRLYEAILAAIKARVASRGPVLRWAWRLLMQLAVAVQRYTGLRPGSIWFAPIRRSIAPRLNYLVSGGAPLARETEQQLEALGWTVLTGYGLAETASLFTGNPPSDRRLASAGKPLAAGEIRISGPDDKGVGEIELRGSSITTGYLNNPEANRTSFTPDGWFRTGDLGFVDRDGFLHVTGRSKEILVLGGGKKVNPEELEQFYGSAPQIREIAVLEEQGMLIAFVRPDPARVRDMGTMNLREGIRVVLAEMAQSLPAYQRLSGFALTDQPLPRTRLGKYRRFLLPGLYRQAVAGGLRREAHELGPEDHALLQDPTANAVWTLLQRRYPEEAVDLDVNLGLDLNLDSFSWMELAITLQDRCGVRLTEADIDAVDSIRDLLIRCKDKQRESHERERAAPAEAVDISHWLAPTGPLLSLLGVLLYTINWCVMRGLFRLRVRGTENVPETGAFVIAPNHASYLDPLVVGAALPLSRLRRVYWAGSVTLLFGTRLRRLFSRVAHVFPVDERHPDAAIAAAVQVLGAGHTAVWFSEGWRSPDGKLQRFLPGIGQVLLRAGAIAVPTYIAGTFKAWPRGRRIPKVAPISVVFGRPNGVDTLRTTGTGRTEEERIADALRERVVALGGPLRTADMPVLEEHANVHQQDTEIRPGTWDSRDANRQTER
jgi:long-chain acyl-CoA synthetase